MKTQPINRVGFKTSWMTDEDSNVNITVEPMQNISNGSDEVALTPAHVELRTRIAMIEAVISGKGFSKFVKEKKAEFLEEYKLFVSLDAQLG